MVLKIVEAGTGERDVFAAFVNALVSMFSSFDALVDYTDVTTMCSSVPTPAPVPTREASTIGQTFGPTIGPTFRPSINR